MFLVYLISRYCCCLPCNNCSDITWAGLGYGNRLCCTHCESSLILNYADPPISLEINYYHALAMTPIIYIYPEKKIS